MDLVYAAADVVISRAGVSSSELCIVKPVILFLLQMLQKIKLKCIVDKKGALMLKESNLMRNSCFEDLLKDQRNKIS
jgi:UDP-N-acetylglucosamine--N-acetylmuramyl-(pentapeptide) pyrophosphoryl-undecaprenol N-acetylglucosamine transferase